MLSSTYSALLTMEARSAPRPMRCCNFASTAGFSRKKALDVFYVMIVVAAPYRAEIRAQGLANLVSAHCGEALLIGYVLLDDALVGAGIESILRRELSRFIEVGERFFALVEVEPRGNPVTLGSPGG